MYENNFTTKKKLITVYNTTMLCTVYVEYTAASDDHQCTLGVAKPVNPPPNSLYTLHIECALVASTLNVH